MSNKPFPKESDHLALLLDILVSGNSSGAIERTEKLGQTLLIETEVLPKKINYGTKEQFESMGIIFGEDADDLFVYVTLPDGWKKVPTGHSMWSHLVDKHERERASIFYKAAFYDRDAFMGISKRFNYSAFFSANEKGEIIETGDATHFATYIMDGGKPIKFISVRPKVYGGVEEDKAEELARKWLEENYPDYKNSLAYWEME